MVAENNLHLNNMPLFIHGNLSELETAGVVHPWYTPSIALAILDIYQG